MILQEDAGAAGLRIRRGIVGYGQELKGSAAARWVPAVCDTAPAKRPIVWSRRRRTRGASPTGRVSGRHQTRRARCRGERLDHAGLALGGTPAGSPLAASALAVASLLVCLAGDRAGDWTN